MGSQDSNGDNSSAEEETIRDDVSWAELAFGQSMRSNDGNLV